MKKFVLLGMLLLLVTGCGQKKEYDYSCTKIDSSDTFKETIKVSFSFDKDKVYKLKSEIIEDHTDPNTANDSYAKYQTTYLNYNENNIISEYKKDEKKVTAIYYLDKADIDRLKVELPYDFKLTKIKFIDAMKDNGFKCEEK